MNFKEYLYEETKTPVKRKKRRKKRVSKVAKPKVVEYPTNNFIEKNDEKWEKWIREMLAKHGPEAKIKEQVHSGATNSHQPWMSNAFTRANAGDTLGDIIAKLDGTYIDPKSLIPVWQDGPGSNFKELEAFYDITYEKLTTKADDLIKRKEANEEKAIIKAQAAFDKLSIKKKKAKLVRDARKPPKHVVEPLYKSFKFNKTLKVPVKMVRKDGERMEWEDIHNSSAIGKAIQKYLPADMGYWSSDLALGGSINLKLRWSK